MPTLQLIIDENGQPVWECSGFGIVVRHQQQAQAQLHWHCQAVARGYEGDPPLLRP